MKVKTVWQFTDMSTAVSIIAGILAIPKKWSLASRSIQPLPAESQKGTGSPGLILSLFSWLSRHTKYPHRFPPIFYFTLVSSPGLLFLEIPHLLCAYAPIRAAAASSSPTQAVHNYTTTGDASPSEAVRQKATFLWARRKTF